MEPKLSDDNEFHKNPAFGSIVERENTQKDSTVMLLYLTSLLFTWTNLG